MLGEEEEERGTLWKTCTPKRGGRLERMSIWRKEESEEMG